MKKKDLEKIGDIVAINIKSILEKQMNYEKVDKAEEYKTSAYDETVSNKFKKLVLNLLDYSETLNININDNSITISANDVKSIKNTNNTNNNTNGPLKLQDDGNYLEISINKERFVMAKGYYNRTCYKDTSMYDYFEPIFDFGFFAFAFVDEQFRFEDFLALICRDAVEILLHSAFVLDGEFVGDKAPKTGDALLPV